MLNDCSAPVFVAGPSRSGTALVRSIINRHPDVHIANETHYFDDLRRTCSPTGVLDSEGQQVAIDYFRALTHRPYGHYGDPELGWLDGEELSDRATALGGRADDYLQAYCEISARREGGATATIWGEKTPRHIFRVDDILASFPNGRVVAMVRDPRAVVASYKSWRNQGGLPGSDDVAHEEKLAAETERTRRSYHPLLLALLWRGQANAALAARRRHGPNKVWVQRYESLVHEPAEATEALTRWLGLDYSPEMLDVPMHNSSFSRFEEGRGVSSETVERWREVLDGGEIAIIQRSCASLMVEHGYAPVEVAAGLLQRLRPYATFPAASVQAARANGERSGGLPSYVLRRVKALVSG
jgi:hypothetical protein